MFILTVLSYYNEKLERTLSPSTLQLPKLICYAHGNTFLELHESSLS